MSRSTFCFSLFFHFLTSQATPHSDKSHLHSVLLISHTCIHSHECHTCTHSSPLASVFKSQHHFHSLPSCSSPSHARLSRISLPCLCSGCLWTMSPLFLSLESCLVHVRPFWPSTIPQLWRPGKATSLPSPTTLSHPALLAILCFSLVPAGPISTPLARCVTGESLYSPL